MKISGNTSVVLAAYLLFSVSALAQDFGLSEIRGGIFSHSVDEPGTFMGMLNAERVHDINVELLFDTPSLTEWVTLGELRPHIGATLSLGGLENMVYAGVSWTVPVFDSPVFVEAAFGGAVHTGTHIGPTPMPAMRPAAPAPRMMISKSVISGLSPLFAFPYRSGRPGATPISLTLSYLRV